MRGVSPPPWRYQTSAYLFHLKVVTDNPRQINMLQKRKMSSNFKTFHLFKRRVWKAGWFICLHYLNTICEWDGEAKKLQRSIFSSIFGFIKDTSFLNERSYIMKFSFSSSVYKVKSVNMIFCTLGDSSAIILTQQKAITALDCFFYFNICHSRTHFSPTYTSFYAVQYSIAVMCVNTPLLKLQFGDKPLNAWGKVPNFIELSRLHCKCFTECSLALLSHQCSSYFPVTSILIIHCRIYFFSLNKLQKRWLPCQGGCWAKGDAYFTHIPTLLILPAKFPKSIIFILNKCSVWITLCAFLHCHLGKRV